MSRARSGSDDGFEHIKKTDFQTEKDKVSPQEQLDRDLIMDKSAIVWKALGILMMGLAALLQANFSFIFRNTFFDKGIELYQHGSRRGLSKEMAELEPN